MISIKAALIAGLLIVLAGIGFGLSGLYPIGADVPHNALTYKALETLREASVRRASKNIEIPDLSKPSLLLSGGADYNDMCISCHLLPGKTESDMTLGLYPSPPNLALNREAFENTSEAAIKRDFWIIKHGIKASGMPAWGLTHDDERIWAMVAFLQKLPALTPEQYQILTAREEGAAAHH